MKTAHDVKLLNGSKQEVTYPGVETVTMPGTDGQDKVFTAGAPIDALEIAPDFSGGDMPLESPEGYVVRGATIKKPEGAEQLIAKGQTLVGITGEYVTPGTVKEVNLDFSSGIETDYLPELTGTTVLDEMFGYGLNFSGGTPLTVGETYLVVWDGVSYNCVAQDASAVIAGAVCVGNAVAFGLSGNNEPFAAASMNGRFAVAALTDTAPTEHTVRIYQASEGQSVKADGEERWSEVTIKKPGTLIPENIVEGVNIAGVLGTLKDGAVGIIEGTISSVTNAIVSTVSPYAFYNKAVEYVELPNCKTINNYAFVGCKNLVSISFPECTSLSGYSQFAGCVKLEEAVFPKCVSMGSGYAFFNCSSLRKAEFPLATSIPASTFISCSKLAEVSFPQCTLIGSSAFYSCKSLTSISFENCISISMSAFAYCSGLQSVYLPKLKEIASNAFTACTALSQSNNYVYYVGDMAVYTTSTFSNASCTLRSGTRLLAQFIFYGKSYMTGIYGLENVEVIGGSAFSNCQRALFGEFQNAKYIGAYAFFSCSKLSYANIPQCLELMAAAFARCTSLSEVRANALPSISANAFSGCTNLKKAFFPNCSVVGNGAFSICSSMSTAVIGNHTLLESSAFYGCTKLVSLYLFGSDVGSFGVNAISSLPASGSIFVRESLIDAFKTAKGWKNYSSRFAGMSDEEIAALYEQEGYIE